MPRLFFFSDHRIETARPMDERLLQVVGKTSPSVGWIPSGSAPEKLGMFFEARRAYYAELGVTDFGMFPLHADYDASRLPWLLSRDIVHLSGGDLYLFLRNLRATGLIDLLRHRARAGGILVGDSAGAMMMTPSLDVGAFDGKPIPGDVQDTSALALVDFEVSPHFGSYGGSEADLRTYATRCGLPVYAMKDGSALAFIDGELEIHGQIRKFEP